MRSKSIKFRSAVQGFTAILLGLGITAAVDSTAAEASPPPYTVYVVNSQCPTNNSVTSVTGSGSSWTVGATDGVGDCPAGVSFSPNGSIAYVVNFIGQHDHTHQYDHVRGRNSVFDWSVRTDIRGCHPERELHNHCGYRGRHRRRD